MFSGQLEEIVKRRRSIRKYKPIPPPEEWIEKILKATVWAPSPSNLQIVKYVRIKSSDIKGKLEKEMHKGKEKLLEKINATNDSKRVKRWIEVYYNRYSSFMFNAPVLFVAGIQKNKKGFYEKLKCMGLKTNYNKDSVFDISLGISICHFILMAESMGLGTCILTTPFIFIENINKLLCINDISFKCFITLGFADETPLPPEKSSISDLYLQI